MTMNRKGLVALLLAVTPIVAACGGDDDATSENSSATSAGTAPADGSDSAATDVTDAPDVTDVTDVTEPNAPATTEAVDAAEPSGTADGEPVRIGLNTDLSGRFVSVGIDIEQAVEMAVEDVNAAGGVNGSPLELVVQDTGGDPAQGVSALRSFVDDDMVAVLGPVSSAEAEVSFAQAADFEIPIFTGTANKEGIVELGEGWAFRNTATNTAIYETAIPAWSSEFDVSSAVLVFDESEAVSAAAANSAIPAVADATGLELLGPVTFAGGETDYSSVVQRIADFGAEGVIVLGVPGDAGLIAKELARQEVGLPVLGHPSQAGSSFFERGGSDIDRWVIPSILDRDSSDEDTVSYLDRIAARDPEPPTIPEASKYYDIVGMIARVLREAGIDGSTDIGEARIGLRDGMLALTDYDGVAGTSSFDGSNDASTTIFLDVVNAGEAQPLG